MLGQVYMLSILIIHMKHFPWSPNNDSSFFTSLNFDALKLKFGNRRYRQYIQCFLERLNKGILSTYIYNIFIYLSTLCSKRYATEWRRNANDGRSNFHRQYFIQKGEAMQTHIPDYSGKHFGIGPIQTSTAATTLHTEDIGLSTKVLVIHMHPAPPCACKHLFLQMMVN